MPLQPRRTVQRQAVQVTILAVHQFLIRYACLVTRPRLTTHVCDNAAAASRGKVAVLAVGESVQECRGDGVSIPGDVSLLSWSPDGLLLAVSSSVGPSACI